MTTATIARTKPADTRREDLPAGNWRQAGCALCGKRGPWILDEAGPGTDVMREPMLAAGFSEEIDELLDDDEQLVARTRAWLCGECGETASHHGDTEARRTTGTGERTT